MATNVHPTHYAIAENNVHIAYQVVGEGPQDLVFVPAFASNMDVWWELPAAARFLNRLASFSRLIMLDKRGTGLSDRLSTVQTLEERMDDVRAVMDAVGSKQAAIFAASEGVPIAIVFAATYPDRVSALALWGGMARWSRAPGYPWSATDEMYTQIVDMATEKWGTGFTAPMLCPSRASEPAVVEWFGRYERVSASPGSFATLTLNNTSIDVRAVLPMISVRTLVAHAATDVFVDIGGSHFLAKHIVGAKYVELPGSDHAFFGQASDQLADEIEEFLTGARNAAVPDRVLSTLLFTDIVDSTQTAAAIGDRDWRDLLARHHATVRDLLQTYRGREIDSAGDGFLAAFDGPARAIRCAQAILTISARQGLSVRAGLHTGECEILGEKLAGIAVHVASRCSGTAQGGEILVTSTVRDLVAGSDLAFIDHGEQRLSGVPGRWRLLALNQSTAAVPSSDQPAPSRKLFEAAVERATRTGHVAGVLSPLTKRESEIARLVAEGSTNRQIAATLFLSERTVEWHVEQILGKLAFSNRAQIASWVGEGLSRGKE